MTVLLDSGIYISAFQYGGVPDEAIEKALLRDELFYCKTVSDETVRTMQNKFNSDPHEILRLLSNIWRNATRVNVPGRLSGVCRDPMTTLFWSAPWQATPI